MDIRRRSKTPTLTTPLGIWLMSGVTAIVLTAVGVNVWLVPVQAKVLLPKLAAMQPAAAPVAQPMAAVKPKLTPAQERRALLRGIASWYGDNFDGQTMANGETFDKNAMTACHPTLPFGSLVKVMNLRNHHSVIVRITDRGALAAGRVLDLSYGAAQKLAMTNAGLAPVVLEVLEQGGKKTANN